MGFLDKIKKFTGQISEVENKIYTNKQDFLEIYERNLQLEKEIAERTKELDIANQRMLTLQHIWEMMNSSTPLSNVLATITKSIKGDLGYLYSGIIQKKADEKGNYIKTVTYAEDELIERLNAGFGVPIQTIKFDYSEESLFAEALINKRIVQTTDLRSMIKAVSKDLPEGCVEKILNDAKSHSVILVPLWTRNTEFGWLIVFSSREKANEAELDFLNLFSKQIELAITIADLFQAVKNQAVTDALTGLYNRRHFEEFLKKEATRAERMKQPFTIISLDLDYLKQINDKYGHSYGDMAIKEVANILKKNARSIDVAARMGGEEFNIILPGVDSKGGIIAAERIRKAISGCKIRKVGKITASIGLATFLEHSDKIDELLEITDQAMYMAKRNGRNQVQIAKPISETSWQEVAITTFMDILSRKRLPIPKNIAAELHEKLATSLETSSTPKEMLYSVADILSATYNPIHAKGKTKSKILMVSNLAKSFDLPKEEIDKLRIATLLYDIGNIMLPQELLQKIEPLTEEEQAEIKKHPLIAAKEILKPISEIQDVIPIIEHHHENWDGTGYPGKFSGKKIPLSSQIILISDAYFALLEPRAYRQAITPQEALEVIKKDSDKKWNRELVKEFVNLIENELK